MEIFIIIRKDDKQLCLQGIGIIKPSGNKDPIGFLRGMNKCYLARHAF